MIKRMVGCCFLLDILDMYRLFATATGPQEMCCFESFYDSSLTKSLEIHIVVINNPFYTRKQFLGLWQSFSLSIHKTPRNPLELRQGDLMHLGV